jgi:hypothetical protein
MDEIKCASQILMGMAGATMVSGMAAVGSSGETAELEIPLSIGKLLVPGAKTKVTEAMRGTPLRMSMAM